MLVVLFCTLIGFCLGYIVRGLKTQPPSKQTVVRHYQAPLTHQQRLHLKAIHYSDSERIRELNRLTSNQSVFLRLLKQTFIDDEIAIKQQRFIVLDRDQMPRAIFEYRDGEIAMKIVDQEDGIPLHLYKGLISSEE